MGTSGGNYVPNHLIAGSNITITSSSGSITLAASGGGHVIQDEGVPRTNRGNLNFVGAGVAVTDDAGNNATIATISGVQHIYNEVQTSSGSALVFLANIANPGTVRAYVNGIRQPVTDGVSATDVVIFNTSPTVGDTLIFDYEVQVT